MIAALLTILWTNFHQILGKGSSW